MTRIIFIHFSFPSAIRMIGEVLVEQGKFAEALEHHTQYLDMARSLRNAVTEQRALATLGWTYLTMSQSEPANLQYALKYTAKCLKAVSRIPSKDVEKRERYRMTGRAQENIGKIHWRLQPAGQLSGGPEEFQPGRGELPRSQALG